MKIRIWGAQGSIPSPLKPDAIKEKIVQAILGMPELDTNNPDEVRAYVEALPPLVRGTAKGNTSCVEIQAGNETLIIDAGSGIRELGLELMKGPCARGEGKLHILFSHLHWDHIQGFPFFIPAFIPGNHITFYSLHDLELALTEQQQYRFFPVAFDEEQAKHELSQLEARLRKRYGYVPAMQAQRKFVRLESGVPFSIGPVKINTTGNDHPGNAFSFRFEDQLSTFVYANDAEYKTLDDDTFQERIDFFKGADAVLFDAQYGLRDSWEKKVDFGHSSAMIGVDFARRAGVKRLLLTHHEPTYSDEQLQAIQETARAYQAQDPSLPTCDVIVAYEGLKFDLAPAGAVDVRLMPENDAAILTPTSIFDEQGVTHLVEQVSQTARQGTSLESILDLSQVERLTTASLKTLVTFSQQRGRGVMVLAAPSDRVKEVIKLAGYRDYFAIYPTVEEAIKAVQAREALNLPGQTINHQYQIAETLGQGPVGTVLKVVDQTDQHQAALRILSPTFGVETIDRFVGQVHYLLDMNHHNIAQVYDCDWSQEGNHTFIVEELLVGPTLQERLSNGSASLTLDEILDLVLDIMLALEYAHNRGVIHGNLKPQDIFLTDAGVKISGFHLGRLEEGRNLLEAPMLFLTASHLAPEQILGQPLDARTDLYALGVILYQLFTTRLPFEGTDHEVMEAHLQQGPIPPRELNPTLSRSVEHLILKLLAKSPNERYANAQQTRQISSSLLFSSSESGQTIKQNLVGRGPQLQILLDCWVQANVGQGQLVFITGESGIGKTSLVQQMANQSETPLVLVGHCREPEGGPAYHPFGEALQAYFATVPPEISRPETQHLISHFSHIVPELRHTIPNLTEPPALGSKQAQLRLISSLTHFIKQATQTRPWLLILEDLQWVDEGSIEFLSYLSRHLPQMHLLLIGTYRNLEMEHNHPLQTALHNLIRNPTYQHLPLARLTPADISNLLENLWPANIPPALITAIYQHTGGNPLYVEEVAKGLMDDGLVTSYAEVWHFPAVEALQLPQSIYDAIERRIHYLNAETRDVLSQAAVLGQTFRFSDVVTMSGLSEWAVLDHLDVALERQLVQEVAGSETLRFRHAEIHHVIYNDLGSLRRRRLHHRAGETIEQRAQPESERMADELAYHFSKAEDLERALVFSIPAARQAQAAYANEAALKWYRRTLDILDQLSADQASSFQPLRLLVCRSLGEVLILVSRWGEGDEIYQQTIELAKQAKDHDTEAWCQAALGKIRWKQGLLTEAQMWLEQAHRAFKKLDNQAGLGETLYQKGTVAAMKGNYEQAQTFYEESLTILRSVGDQFRIAVNLHNLGNLFRNSQAYPIAHSRYMESLTIYVELEALLNIAELLGDMAELAVLQKKSDRAMRLTGAAERHFKSLGTPDSVVWQDRVDKLLLLAKQALDEEDIATAQAEGRAMSLETAVEYARQMD